MKELEVAAQFKTLVKGIFFLQSDTSAQTSLPIYADGYPGIVISVTESPFIMKPKNKKLSDFYLYGQTLKPIEMVTRGKFSMLIYKLQPFAVYHLFGISPGELNDDCFDLTKFVKKVPASIEEQATIKFMYEFLESKLEEAAGDLNASILMATSIIIESKGDISINEVAQKVFLTERTFERQFSRQTGLGPKQFADIVKFNFSIGKVAGKENQSLTEIGYESGYADQSHFIRSFKKFVGTTPREFQKYMDTALFPTLETGRLDS